MRFPYSTTDPAQDAFDSLPRLPLRLRADSRALNVMGLVDSGATVHVLPYEVGLQLGMRPLVAHCHLGLGTLYATTGRVEQAGAALTTAIDLYRAMDMTFWLPPAEAALVQVA